MSRISNLVKKAENRLSHNNGTIIQSGLVKREPTDDAPPKVIYGGTVHKESFLDKLKDAGHNIGSTIEKDAKSVGGAIKKGAEKTASAVKTEAQKLPSQLKAAGSAIEQGALEAGKTISELESDILPSSSKIILETGLVVAGIAVVGLLVLKFV